MNLNIGMFVKCGNRSGRLSQVFVDSSAMTVTHLGVTIGKREVARLVPISMVVSSNEEIQLLCSQSDFDYLDPIEEKREVTLRTAPVSGIGNESSMGSRNGTLLNRQFREQLKPQYAISSNRPAGTVMLNHLSSINGSDHRIGHLAGLVMESSGRCVIGLTVVKGRLWAKKTFAVSSSMIKRFGDGDILLSLPKSDIVKLASFEIS